MAKNQNSYTSEFKLINSLILVHYCHPNCKPFQNIMRLSKEKAFLLAEKLTKENPHTTAFYRFADFENYYDVVSVSTPYANTRKQVKSKEVRVYVKMNMTYIDENGSLQKI